MFSTILIANRGEIACRVIRTARRMGIATVAVYSDADADAAHVALADQAFRIGPPPARDSYLRGDVILDVARRSGAQAIHPGYGFLSENAAFAEACAEAGMVFIGPPPAAIRAMGDKAASKALMEQAGVPLVPGYHGAAQDAAVLQAAAEQIGFPVLIKASAGGGGKGMRVVRDNASFGAELAGARREALAAFGDDRVLIERYLQRPRHVEIQVFADTLGHCVSLFERDCSVQRRHQKIIEEAPAPGLSDTLRRAMGDAAVAAARAVGYVGAGTVEFIVEDGGFHFMEMNTRLQVEHPVTEAITGQDLVEWQLRVAAGQALPLRQDELTIDGHAFEARIYAEDPARDFLPSVGTIAELHLPQWARIDSGVRPGDAISPNYDPMIAKLIVHGPDRAAALGRLRAALGACAVAGVQTNLRLLGQIAAHPAFAAQDIDTGFIARHVPDLSLPPPPPAAIAAAVLAVLGARAAAARRADDSQSPWGGGQGWRMNLAMAQQILLRVQDVQVSVTAAPAQHGWQLSWEGAACHAHMAAPGRIVIDDASLPVRVMADGAGFTVALDGQSWRLDEQDALAAPDAQAAGSLRVQAPIPARVASIGVAVGEAVTRGQVLLVLEAMKMELSLTAAADGVVAQIRCAAGDMVQEGVDLVLFEDSAAT